MELQTPGEKDRIQKVVKLKICWTDKDGQGCHEDFEVTTEPYTANGTMVVHVRKP